MLQDLQLELAEAIFSGDLHNDYVKPAHRLAIYQQHVFSHLTTSLKETYPYVLKLVGADCFHLLAQAYIQQYPSGSGNLNEYGEYFSQFINDYAPLNDHDYLSEVAAFEWACHIIFFAADHIGFDKHKLETLSPENYHSLHFVLHPANKLMACRYPLLRIIDLCEGQNNDEVNLNAGGLYLLILRQQLDTMLIPLSSAEFAFLTALQQQQSLEEALEAAMTKDLHFKLEEKLPRWIQGKVIVDCY